jgi:hypothetical protein
VLLNTKNYETLHEIRDPLYEGKGEGKIVPVLNIVPWGCMEHTESLTLSLESECSHLHATTDLSLPREPLGPIE